MSGRPGVGGAYARPPAENVSLSTRAWSIAELDVLQDLPTPVVVLLYSNLNSTAAGHSCQLVFENVSFLRRFGLPRSQLEYSAKWEHLSKADQKAKWERITQILQADKVTQAHVDAHQLLRPMFRKVDPGTPSYASIVHSKPIKIHTALGKTETAIMHLFETPSAGTATPAAPNDEATVTAVDYSQPPADSKDADSKDAGSTDADTMGNEKRICALHERSPIQMFMFDRRGELLNANRAARKGLQVHAGEADHGLANLRTLFDLGVYSDEQAEHEDVLSGGKKEADKAYEEALNDVFGLEVEYHQHMQAYPSPKDGTVKWALLEMWPLKDPVEGGPAVLVHRSSITRLKRAELLFRQQKDALEKQNQALEIDWAAMLDEKFRLQQEAKALAQHLNALLNDKFGPQSGKGFDADTPIDKALSFLQFIVAGYCPPVSAALDLYRMLSEPGIDLRQPVRLENQLLKDNVDMDSEVGQSILQLLQGRERRLSVTALGPAKGGGTPEQIAARNAATSQALSRHPDLADAPVLDMTRGDSIDGSRLAGGAPQARPLAPVFVPPVVTPAVERMLQDAECNWQFDIFAFAEMTPGISLSMLSFHLLKSTGLVKEFDLNEAKLVACLRKIESGYDAANPYHNSTHVASVVQMTHMLLVHGGILKSNVMNRVQQLASYWSATVHDYEHGGCNNDFLIKTVHPLAVTYNDSSPLENHHLAASSRILYMPEYCFPPKEMASQLISLRSTCISQVLGTDMKKHFDIVSRFQQAFKQPPGSPGGSRVPFSSKDLETSKVEDKTLIFQVILKCADIGHLTAAPKTHKRWAVQLEEEFFRQGDKERSLGMTVSPLMDRNQQGGMTRSQLGFFNIVGAPLFVAVTELFEDAMPMMRGLQTNYHHWETGKIAELTI